MNNEDWANLGSANMRLNSEILYNLSNCLEHVYQTNYQSIYLRRFDGNLYQRLRNNELMDYSLRGVILWLKRKLNVYIS